MKFPNISRWIFHPFLFALYPPLYLLVNNLDEVKPISVVRSLLVSLLLAGLLLVVLRLLVRDWKRAAIVTSLALVLFFSFGHIYHQIEKAQIAGILIGRYRYLLLLWVALFAAGLFLIARRLRNPDGLTEGLNFFGVVMAGLLIFQWIQNPPVSVKAASQETKAAMQELGIATITAQLKPPAQKDLRDVYYLMLDGYTRADVLQEEFGFDNSAFLKELEKRGFFIADCSLSNYSKTSLSVSAVLNMDYLPPEGSIGQQLIAQKERWQSFGIYMRHNVVRHTLEELGYKLVAFETGHGWANVDDAEVYYTLKEPPTLETINPAGFNPYEMMLMDSTALTILHTRIEKLAEELAARQSNAPAAAPNSNGDEPSSSAWTGQGLGLDEVAFFKLDTFTMQRLQEVSSAVPSPKFVYAHLLSTHPPFVFTPDGKYQADNTEAGYLSAIQFTNRHVLSILDQILASPGPKPVIIIQADHARVTAQHKTTILNAYYMPDGGNAQLYRTITPVNTFRLVFNQYFGAHLPLLPDHSMVATVANGIYTFTPVLEDNPACR